MDESLEDLAAIELEADDDEDNGDDTAVDSAVSDGFDRARLLSAAADVRDAPAMPTVSTPVVCRKLRREVMRVSPAAYFQRNSDRGILILVVQKR